MSVKKKNNSCSLKSEVFIYCLFLNCIAPTFIMSTDLSVLVFVCESSVIFVLFMLISFLQLTWVLTKLLLSCSWIVPRCTYTQNVVKNPCYSSKIWLVGISSRINIVKEAKRWGFTIPLIMWFILASIFRWV